MPPQLHHLVTQVLHRVTRLFPRLLHLVTQSLLDLLVTRVPHLFRQADLLAPGAPRLHHLVTRLFPRGDLRATQVLHLGDLLVLQLHQSATQVIFQVTQFHPLDPRAILLSHAMRLLRRL